MNNKNNKKQISSKIVKTTRVFTIVDYPNVGETYGKYTGKYPGDAADKVLTELAKKVNLKNSNEKNFIFFTIRDVSSGKEYSYIGTRVELYKPVKLDNGKIVRFRNNITRLTGDKLSIYDIYDTNNEKI